MADIKFACPSCAQHITCDELWSGHEVQCPGCQSPLVVPAKPPPVRMTGASTSQGAHGPLAPKVPEKTKLATQIPAQQPAKQGVRDIPIRNLTGPPPKQVSPLVKIAKVAAVLVVLGVGGYFGYGLVMKLQGKATAEAREAEKNADGGQVGHIADLYGVLDATEPGGAGLSKGARGAGPRQRSGGVGEGIPMPGDADDEAQPGSPKTPEKELPVIPAVYTLDPQRAKIPEGRVNGMISGTNFVAEAARLDRVRASTVLRLIQGATASPDREILVYLRLKAGEKLGGQKLDISPDMKGTGVPQVAKRWKTNPRYAAQMKSFGTGYVLKLELGQPEEGTIPGKIFVALPDNEKTVVAGVFSAATTLFEGTDEAAGQAVPVTPSARGVSSAESEMFKKRYGLTPGTPAAPAPPR